jgi:hypothetical protein
VNRPSALAAAELRRCKQAILRAAASSSPWAVLRVMDSLGQSSVPKGGNERNQFPDLAYVSSQTLHCTPPSSTVGAAPALHLGENPFVLNININVRLEDHETSTSVLPCRAADISLYPNQQANHAAPVTHLTQTPNLSTRLCRMQTSHHSTPHPSLTLLPSALPPSATLSAASSAESQYANDAGKCTEQPARGGASDVVHPKRGLPATAGCATGTAAAEHGWQQGAPS